VKDEYRFTPLADDMHMRRSMVIGVDDSSQAIETDDSWHLESIA